MGKQGKPRTEGNCTYCGQFADLTVDHVIPRCLFNGAVPGDTPRVLACQQCNGNAKSADDAFLRDMLVRDARLAANPIAQDIRHGALARAHTRGQSQYLRQSTNLRAVPSPTGSGLVIFEPALPVERVRPIFMRLVRGLLLAYERYELTLDTNVDVLRAHDSAVALAEAQHWASDTSGMVHTVQAGDGSVFWGVYYHTHSQDQPDLSMWWLRFYERVVYWVGTGMSNLSLGEF